MGNKIKDLSKRVKSLEDTMSRLDGKKARKPRKKKVYTLDNLPATKGFGDKMILKDGHYGDISVYFGKVYERAEWTEEEHRKYLLALRERMIEAFGYFHQTWDDCIPVIEVDNSHLRKHRKKKKKEPKPHPDIDAPDAQDPLPYKEVKRQYTD